MVDRTTAEIVKHNFRSTLFAEHFSQTASSHFGTSVNARISNDNAFRILRFILRPKAIETECLSHFTIAKERAVERTNHFNVKLCCFLEHLRHLHAILTADVEVVATSFLRPIVGVRIIRAEFTESISREERFVAIIIGHDYFGPMHHGSRDEVEIATTKIERATVGHSDSAVGHVKAFVELSNERQSLCTGHNFQVGILVHRFSNGASVVWLYVLNDKVIRCATFKSHLEIHLPLFSATCIDGVHDANFLIENHITVVAHTFWRAILTLEKVEITIISTNVLNGV